MTAVQAVNRAKLSLAGFLFGLAVGVAAITLTWDAVESRAAENAHSSALRAAVIYDKRPAYELLADAYRACERYKYNRCVDDHVEALMPYVARQARAMIYGDALLIPIALALLGAFLGRFLLDFAGAAKRWLTT